MTKRAQELFQRHTTLSHAMQAGVATELALADPDLPPNLTAKHLRVGVNVALSDMGGLVALLIKKGVFTEEEYFEAICETMENEVKMYEEQLSKAIGKPITLV